MKRFLIAAVLLAHVCNAYAGATGDVSSVDNVSPVTAGDSMLNMEPYRGVATAKGSNRVGTLGNYFWSKVQDTSGAQVQAYGAFGDVLITATRDTIAPLAFGVQGHVKHAGDGDVPIMHGLTGWAEISDADAEVSNWMSGVNARISNAGGTCAWGAAMYVWPVEPGTCSDEWGIAQDGGDNYLYGHTTIGDFTHPTEDAVLDLACTDCALLPPRLTETERDAVTPTEGMMLYNSTAGTPQFYNGSVWAGFGGISGSGTDNHLMRWDGTSAAQDSTAILSDAGALSGLLSVTGMGSGTAGFRLEEYPGATAYYALHLGIPPFVEGNFTMYGGGAIGDIGLNFKSGADSGLYITEDADFGPSHAWFRTWADGGGLVLYDETSGSIALSAAAAGSDHTATFQDADGTVAYLSDIITDHGDLTGLGDDDHPQYHNDSRADTWLATKDTDDLTEGATNLYYTTARANADIDARVTKAFVDALDVDADTLDGHDWSEVPIGANPTASVGFSAVNGSAATFLRSDGAPALSSSIYDTGSVASVLAKRDTSANLYADNFVAVLLDINNDVTLTVDSPQFVYSSSGGLNWVTLPVVSTLTTGHSYTIINAGGGNVEVFSSGGNPVMTVFDGYSARVTAIATTGTTAASWKVEKEYADENAQDAIGGMLNAGLTYTDGTPLLALSDRDWGDITSTSNGLTWNLDAGVVDTTELAANAVDDTRLRNSSALSVIGQAANSSGDPADIVASADGQILRRSGTSLGFGTILPSSVDGTDNSKCARFDASGVLVAASGDCGSGDTTYTDEQAQDALGAMVNASLTYTDATPLFAIASRDFGDITTSSNGTVMEIDADTITQTEIATNGVCQLEIATDCVNSAEITDNQVGNADIRQSSGLSVIGNSTNSTANVADITAGSDGHVLRRSGTSLGFGTILPSVVDGTDSDKCAKFNSSGVLVAATGDCASGDTTGTIPTAANPTASVGLSAVNGSASTYMRSDGAPALSQSIAPTWTGQHTFSEARSIASGASAVLDDVNVSAQTTTITGTTAITTAKGFNKVSIYRPTLSDASAVTVTNAATLYIENAPAASGAGPVTITNPYSIWADAGVARLDGGISVISPSSTVYNASAAEPLFLVNNVNSSDGMNVNLVLGTAGTASLKTYKGDTASNHIGPMISLDASPGVGNGGLMALYADGAFDFDTSIVIAGSNVLDYIEFHDGANQKPFKMYGATNKIARLVGTSTSEMEMGGTFCHVMTDTGNDANTNEKDLASCTLPANAMAANGDWVRITATFAWASNGNSKTNRIYFGGTAVYTDTASSSGSIFQVELLVTRTGASAQSITGSVVSDTAARITAIDTTTAKTMSSSQIVKATGETGTASANNVVLKDFLIEWGGSNP